MELKVGAFGAEGLVAPMSRTKVCMRRERRFKPTGFPPGGTPRLHGGQDARRYDGNARISIRGNLSPFVKGLCKN